MSQTEGGLIREGQRIPWMGADSILVFGELLANPNGNAEVVETEDSYEATVF